jgi:hypothetical protein
MPLHDKIARGHFTTQFSNLSHAEPRHKSRTSQSPHKEACGSEAPAMASPYRMRSDDPTFPAQRPVQESDQRRSNAEEGNRIAGLGFAEPKEKWKWLNRLQSSESEPDFRPPVHPSSLQTQFEGMALYGEPAPQTTKRRSDYCSPFGQLPAQSEREQARQEEREREHKRKKEREMDRMIREVSLLHERERERSLGGTGAEEAVDWEAAKLAALQTSVRANGRAGDDAKGRQASRVAILDKRERSLTSIGARVRVRRAHLLQVRAFALLRYASQKSPVTFVKETFKLKDIY